MTTIINKKIYNDNRVHKFEVHDYYNQRYIGIIEASEDDLIACLKKNGKSIEYIYYPLEPMSVGELKDFLEKEW